MALTLPTQYEPLKLSGPVFAGIYQSGVPPTGAVFEKGWPIKAGIECEMVARMGKDVHRRQRRLHRRNASSPSSPISIAAPKWSRTATPTSPR